MFFERQLFIYPDPQIFLSRGTVNMDTIQSIYCMLKSSKLFLCALENNIYLVLLDFNTHFRSIKLFYNTINTDCRYVWIHTHQHKIACTLENDPLTTTLKHCLYLSYKIIQNKMMPYRHFDDAFIHSNQP